MNNEGSEITTNNEGSEITTVNKSTEITTATESPKITTVNENLEVTTTSKKRKRTKSESWVFKEGHFVHHDPKKRNNHCFIMLFISFVNELIYIFYNLLANYAKCTHCNSVLRHDNETGTSSLIRHMKNTKCKKHLNNGSQQTLQLSASGLTAYKFSQEKSRQDMNEMIIRHAYSFRMVGHEGFLKFIDNLQPKYKVICEKTVHDDCVNIVEKLKVKARTIIEEAPGRLSYTTDLWTSIQTLGYMVVTCHFIDRSWKLQKLVISFKLVPTPHTGVAISETLLKCFDDWNVTSRTLAITMDNATSNDAAITNLKHKLDEKNMLVAEGSLLHQRCCAHILNLIVNDGLKMVKNNVSKIRECTKWIHSSQSRLQNFEDAIVGCCPELATSQRPALDVPTRWNSVYLMLISTIPYKRVFERLALRDINFEQIMPSEEEWKRAKSISNFLKPFYEGNSKFLLHLCEITPMGIILHKCNNKFY